MPQARLTSASSCDQLVGTVASSPKATVLVNTLFLADFATAYTGRTCRVRDVFGAGPVVPNCLELLVVAFTTDEGAELTPERTFRTGKVVRAVFNSRERRGWETIGAQCTIRIPGQPSHGTARCAPEPLAGRISPLRGPRAAGRPLQHPRKRRPRRDFASRLAVCATASPHSWKRSQATVFAFALNKPPQRKKAFAQARLYGLPVA